MGLAWEIKTKRGGGVPAGRMIRDESLACLRDCHGNNFRMNQRRESHSLWGLSRTPTHFCGVQEVRNRADLKGPRNNCRGHRETRKGSMQRTVQPLAVHKGSCLITDVGYR